MGFYYLSGDYGSNEHAALGICINGIMSLLRPSGTEPKDLFSPRVVFNRIFQGTGQGGEGIVEWELVRWKYRGGTEAGLLHGDFRDDDFLAWTGEDSPYNPSWRVYGSREFELIFVHACHDFVGENPSSRVEIDLALRENHLHL